MATSSGQALESLLLFQSVASHGATEQSFARIAQSLKASSLLRCHALGEERLDARALIASYLRVLRAEAADTPRSEGPSAGAHTFGPTTVQDATPLLHLVPRIIPKLYNQYRDHVVREIRQDEERYEQLQSSTVTHLRQAAAPTPPLQTSSSSAGKTAIGPRPSQPLDSNGRASSPLDASRRPSPPSASGSSTTPNLAPQLVAPPTTMAASSIANAHNAARQMPRAATAPSPAVGSTKAVGPQPAALQSPLTGVPQPLPPLAQPSDPALLSSSPRPLNNRILIPTIDQQRRESLPTHRLPQTPVSTQPVNSHSSIPRSYLPPPFSINGQASAVAQSRTTRDGAPLQQPSGAGPAPQAEALAEPHQTSTSAACDPSSSQDTPLPPLSAAALLRQRSDVHFSPGSSTGWKAPPVPEQPRPRSISPMTDGESGHDPATARKVSTRRKKQAPRSPAPKLEPLADRAERKPSKTPSVPATSSQARTRSQSIVSFADDTSMTSFPGLTRSGKSDVNNTPTPGDRVVARASRGTRGRGRPPRAALNPQPDTTTTMKRKRASSIPETPTLTSEPASPGLPRQPQQRPDTILARKNFHKMMAPLMDQIASDKHASLFANAVNAKTSGYYDSIHVPTDLKTIRSQIGAGTRAVANAVANETGSPSAGGASTLADNGALFILPCTEDFQPPKAIVNSDQLEQELMRMFANAVMFNEGDDGVVADTREMFANASAALAQWRGDEADEHEITGGSTVKRRRAA